MEANQSLYLLDARDAHSAGCKWQHAWLNHSLCKTILQNCEQIYNFNKEYLKHVLMDLFFSVTSTYLLAFLSSSGYYTIPPPRLSQCHSKPHPIFTSSMWIKSKDNRFSEYIHLPWVPSWFTRMKSPTVKYQSCDKTLLWENPLLTGAESSIVGGLKTWISKPIYP